MAARRGFAIDRDRIDVGGGPFGDDFCERILVEVLNSDGGADVQIGIMDGVLRGEGRKLQVLSRTGNCGGRVRQSAQGVLVDLTGVETEEVEEEQSSHCRLVIVTGQSGVR